MAGAYDVVIAAGVENMTRVPMGASVADGKYGFPFGPMMTGRYPNLVPQGISAELISEKWGISREANDAFAVESHQRAARATEEGRFEREILPLTLTTDDGEETMTRDEGIRPDSSVEKLATLKPAFKEDGVITAANSSQITDGAAAVLIMSEEKANELGLKPRARFHTFALAGVDPVMMLTGPIPATTKVLERAKMTHRPDRSRRDQRGVRAGRARVGEGAPPRHEQGERERRRHRPRSPARLLGRPPHDHAAQRARAHRRPLRPPDDVRGRRHGQRHDHRAPGLTGPAPRRPCRRSGAVVS